MSAIQPICAWVTFQGKLDLFSEKDGYKLLLKRKDNTEISIPKPQDLDLQAIKIEEFCERYFPTLTQSNNLLWTVEFHLSAVPVEVRSQQNKNMGAFNFAFNSLEDKKLVNFSKDAPFYRRVNVGLNIQGECDNVKCEAYERVVYIPKGIGSFNIAQLKNKCDCPACNEKIPFEKVNNLGFWSCKYQIEGKRADRAEDFIKEEIAEKERYTTFEPGEEGAWEYLQVTTEKLTIAPKASTPVTKKPEQKVSSKSSTDSGCIIL